MLTADAADRDGRQCAGDAASRGAARHRCRAVSRRRSDAGARWRARPAQRLREARATRRLTGVAAPSRNRGERLRAGVAAESAAPRAGRRRSKQRWQQATQPTARQARSAEPSVLPVASCRLRQASALDRFAGRSRWIASASSTPSRPSDWHGVDEFDRRHCPRSSRRCWPSSWSSWAEQARPRAHPPGPAGADAQVGREGLLHKIAALRAAGWTKWEAANLSAWSYLGLDPPRPDRRRLTSPPTGRSTSSIGWRPGSCWRWA